VTEKPFIVKNSNVIYIAGPIFKDYALKGNKVYKDIVLQCISQLLDSPLVKAVLPSTAEVTLRSQEGRYILHLLHYIPHRRCKALDTIEDRIPLYGSEISVRIKRKPVRVYLAPQMDNLEFLYDGSYVNIKVPKIDGHQMVVIEL
jgi:hypothetical protein